MAADQAPAPPTGAWHRANKNAFYAERPIWQDRGVVTLDMRHRAIRITDAVRAACPDEDRLSVAWPTDDQLVVRLMRDLRFVYKSFPVTDEGATVAAILDWIRSAPDRP